MATLSKTALLALFFSFFTASVMALDVETWWEHLWSLHGLRIEASIGGWNFWYKEDADYISDTIGSWFSGKEGRVFDVPVLGIIVCVPIWKCVLWNISAGVKVW